MKVIVKKVENGWIVRRKNEHRSEDEPRYTEFVCVTDGFGSDTNDEIAEMLHQVMHAVDCDGGKRQMKNIHITLLPGYDCGPMQDEKQITAAVEIADKILSSLGDLEKIPTVGTFDNVKAIRAAVAAYKKVVAAESEADTAKYLREQEEKKEITAAEQKKKKKVI